MMPTRAQQASSKAAAQRASDQRTVLKDAKASDVCCECLPECGLRDVPSRMQCYSSQGHRSTCQALTDMCKVLECAPLVTPLVV